MTDFPYASYDSWKTTVPADENPSDYGKCSDCGETTDLCHLCDLCPNCCVSKFDGHDDLVADEYDNFND